GQLEECPRAAAVVVIDRIGMLRNLYALADVAFVGGSLVKAGGHNPLEPAALAIPVVFGPHTDDFGWICRTLEDGGGAFRVFGSAQLAQIVGELMRDNKRRRQAGRNARAVFHRHRGAVTRTMEIIAKAGAPGESRR
ncbi:MAG TPA: hypothetical protein VLT88_14030, partial [Desulfosarcina sp.]|nr:hypothetical protein [Desulfosarcina sp.]